nr:transposase [Bacillus cereus]
MIAIIENKPPIAHLPAVKEKLNVLKEARYARTSKYLTDTDARVRHKTADSSFFGYKTHLAISDEPIITAAVVTTGEKSDGHYLQGLVEKSKVTGMKVETVIADTDYSEKTIYFMKKNKAFN